MTLDSVVRFDQQARRKKAPDVVRFAHNSIEENHKVLTKEREREKRERGLVGC